MFDVLYTMCNKMPIAIFHLPFGILMWLYFCLIYEIIHMDRSILGITRGEKIINWILNQTRLDDIVYRVNKIKMEMAK